MDLTRADERTKRILEEAKEIFPDLMQKDCMLDSKKEGDGLSLSRDGKRVTIRYGTPQDL